MVSGLLGPSRETIADMRVTELVASLREDESKLSALWDRPELRRNKVSAAQSLFLSITLLTSGNDYSTTCMVYALTADGRV